MPRGIKLTPEERQAREEAIAKKRLESVTRRESRKKERQARDAEKLAQKRAVTKENIVFFGPGSTELHFVKQVAKNYNVIFARTPTEVLAQRSRLIFVTGTADDVISIDRASNGSVVMTCYVGSLTKVEGERLESTKNTWNVVMLPWNGDGSPIVGGVRPYCSVVSEVLRAASPKLYVTKTSMYNAIATGEARKLSSDPAEMRRFCDSHGHAGDEIYQLATGN
jgi:hypothetical protein